MQNVRGRWGSLRIIEEDTADIKSEVLLRMTLKEAYNKDRSLLFKVMYGGPIAIGYLEVSLYYELKGRWRLRLEILTNEQFLPSSDTMHPLIVGPATPEVKLSSHTFLQLWSKKLGIPGALELLPRDKRSIKNGAEFDRRHPFIGVYLIHRPLWLLFLILVGACVMMGIIGARWKSTDVWRRSRILRET